MMQQKVNTHKGGDDMCPWNFRKGFLRLTTILLMLLILALMGCSDDDDDDDDVTAGDLAGRTFVFADAGFFDPALTGLSARTGVRQRDRQYNAFRADPGRHGAYGYCDHWFTAESARLLRQSSRPARPPSRSPSPDLRDRVWYSTRTRTSVTEQTSHLMEMSSCSERVMRQ